MTALRHLGAAGLFFLAILDSTPLPTLGGPDILMVILVATKRNPWWEYAAVASVGSMIGAWITFRLARRAGRAYLNSQFGQGRVPGILQFFDHYGAGALAASSAIPFPFPTSMLFAAAGASGYDVRRFLAIVGPARTLRYVTVAFVAERYGRHIIRVFRHPLQYWGWLLLFTVLSVAIVFGGIAARKRLVMPVPDSLQPGHA